MSEIEQFIIVPEPTPESHAAAIICGHKVIQDLGVDGMCDFQAFVHEVLATTIPPSGWVTPGGVFIPRPQYEALMALQPIVAKLASARAPINDSVYRDARAALAACRAAGNAEEEGK